ncbi:MAG TPA: prolipoprotein diacylglyceryl transferase [Planctomycetota bacterium]|nr:prolipoprotein diacylglyceryl transferase [Planctomycetota bacterium]
MHPILFEIPNRATLDTSIIVVEIVVGIVCLLGWLALRAKAPSGWAATTLSTVAILVGLHFALSYFMKGDSIKIYTFGVVIILGFLAGARFMSTQTDKLGIPSQTVFDWAFWLLVTGIVGSRILYALLNFEEFETNKLQIFAIWNGGLVWYGGLIPAVIVGIALLYKWKLPVLPLCDACASAIMLALGIGRWSCLLAGDDYGKATELWQGIRFYSGLVPEGLRGIPLHPTELYMSLNALWLFFILEWIRRSSSYAGRAFAAMLILYALTRALFIEPFRGDFVERNPAWKKHVAVELRVERAADGPPVTLERGAAVSGGGRTGRLLCTAWADGAAWDRNGKAAPTTLALEPGKSALVWAVSDRPLTKAEAAAFHRFNWPIDRIEGAEGATIKVIEPRAYNSDLPQPPGFVSTSQWISIAVVLGGVLVLLIARKLKQPGFAEAVAARKAA